MVAQFYRVSSKTIEHIGSRNKKELEKYGYKSYSKVEIEKIQKTQLGFFEKIPNRGLRLYPVESVVIICMIEKNLNRV